MNKETYLLTPSPQGDLCVAKMIPPPGSRGPGGPGDIRSDPGHSASGDAKDRSVRCEASRNLKWSITNTGINAPVYKLTLPNPDAPGHEQPLFQISKPNPNAPYWTMFYFTYAGHLIPPKRIEFGKIQKNAAQGSGGGGGTRVTISGKSPEEKAVWQTLGEGNEDMVEWIVLCAALNVLDEEIIKAAAEQAPPISASRRVAASPQISGPSAFPAPGRTAVPSSRPSASPRPGAVPSVAPPRQQQQQQQGSAPMRGPPPPLQKPQRQPQHQPQPILRGGLGGHASPNMQQQYTPQQQAQARMPTQQGAYPKGSPHVEYQGSHARPAQPYQPGGAKPTGAVASRAPGGGIILNSPASGYGGDGFGGGGGFGAQGGINGARSPQAAGPMRRF